jgi:hypothetical protein
MAAAPAGSWRERALVAPEGVERAEFEVEGGADTLGAYLGAVTDVGLWALVTDVGSWALKVCDGTLDAELLLRRATLGSRATVAPVQVVQVAATPQRVWVFTGAPQLADVVAVRVDESLFEPLGWCVAMGAEMVLAAVCAPPGIVADAVTSEGLDGRSAQWVRERVGSGAQAAGLCRLLAAVQEVDPAPSCSPLWWAALGAVRRAARSGWWFPPGDGDEHRQQVVRASMLEEASARTGVEVTVLAELAAPEMLLDDLVAVGELVAAPVSER